MLMALPTLFQQDLVTFVGTLCGQTVMSTFWYELADAGTAITNKEAQDDFVAKIGQAAGLVDKYLAVCPDNYSLDQIWMQEIKPNRVMKAVYPQLLQGQSGFTAPSPNSTWSITRRAEIADRKSVSTLRGPFPVDGAIAVNGLITLNAYLTDLGDLANALKPQIVGPIKGAKWNPVIFNPRRVGAVSRPIVQTVVSTEVRVQRRRTVGLGI
jgi:hypothetical protein